MTAQADTPGSVAGGLQGDGSVTPQTRALVLLHRWSWVLITFIASRLIIAGLIRLSRMIFYHGEFWQRNGITGVLTQGDGARYLEIASSGYGVGQESIANVGFFPLYPAIIRVFALVFEPAMAAMVVSNIALLGAGILLKELVDWHYKQPRITNAAVTFLMFSPVSFLFSGAYPESTFLVLALGAFYAAARSRWLTAALCGMAVALTSSIGFLIVVPLAIEYLRRERDAEDAPQASPIQRLLLLAIVPLGCIAFLLFSYLRFADFFAPFANSPLWLGGFIPPWTSIAETQLLPKFYRNFTGLMLCLGFATWIAGILLRVRASYLVFAGLLLAAYACSPSLASIARQLSVVFPLFVILAVLSRRVESTYELLLASSFTLFSFCTLMAANGHWMR